MSEVSLRSYLHDIEQNIEAGQLDQAIAHCKHVLQSYPKCVDIYRLLGNAYLESQRYTDAGDIFQRVISSIPDDFISQIGMSVIREDEGNLDEAIYHMERAFEVQPSNSMIQDELRRLYGKRDNVAPPRIRLTRGALARLYAKGELYPQAIGEIRAALNENPNSLDLEVLLAEIYLKTGKKAEATDAAQSVLRSLPNCISAIKIMVQVLSRADREMEFISYRQKLALMDPYSAYTDPNDPTSDAVPDQAVQIEKLVWKVDETDNQFIEAASADLAEESREASNFTQQEQLPDWLSQLVGSSFHDGTGAQTEIASPDTQPETEMDLTEVEPTSASPTGSTTPDLLDEGEQEIHSNFVATQKSSETTTPDFGHGTVEMEGMPQKTKPELPDWLKALSTEETKEPVDKAKPSESEGSEQERGELPDWLVGAGMLGATAMSLEEEKTEQSGQLSKPPVTDRPEIQEQPEEVEAEVSKEFEGPVFSEDETSPEQEPAKPAEEIPEWLLELQQEAAHAEQAADEGNQSESVAGGDEQPDWLPDWLEESSPTPSSEKVVEKEAQVPDSLIEDEMKEQPQTLSGVESEEDEIPDWLKGVEPEETRLAAERTDVEFPDWKEALESPVAVDKSASTESENELPEWLREEEPSEGEIKPSDTDRGVPEWLVEAGVGNAADSEIKETSTKEIPEQELFDEKSLPAWLFEDESKAGEPVKEEITPTKAFDYLGDTQPTRVRSTTEAEELSAAAGEPSETTAEPPIAAEVPAKTPVAAEAPAEAPVSAQDPLDEAFTWLMGLKVDEKASETPEEIESDREVIEPTGANVPAEELEAGISSEELSNETAFAWLESLAVKQDADEALLRQPEEGIEEASDWEKEDMLVEVQEPAKPVEIKESLGTEMISQETIPSEAGQGQLESEEAFPVEQEEAAVQEFSAEEETSAQIPEYVTEEPVASPVEQAIESLREEEKIPDLPDWLAEKAPEVQEEQGWNPPESQPETNDLNDALINESEPVSTPLAEAQALLSGGDVNQAMEVYSKMIQEQENLESIVSDLENASRRFPGEINVWQNLGDAYIRLNKVPEALNAFIAAEKLLS